MHIVQSACSPRATVPASLSNIAASPRGPHARDRLPTWAIDHAGLRRCGTRQSGGEPQPNAAGREFEVGSWLHHRERHRPQRACVGRHCALWTGSPAVRRADKRMMPALRQNGWRFAYLNTPSTLWSGLSPMERIWSCRTWSRERGGTPAPGQHRRPSDVSTKSITCFIIYLLKWLFFHHQQAAADKNTCRSVRSVCGSSLYLPFSFR